MKSFILILTLVPTLIFAGEVDTSKDQGEVLEYASAITASTVACREVNKEDTTLKKYVECLEEVYPKVFKAILDNSEKDPKQISAMNATIFACERAFEKHTDEYTSCLESVYPIAYKATLDL